MSLDSLPTEIIWAICEWLGHAYPRSVLSLALTSKQCYLAASALLYRSIIFKAHNPEELAQDVQRWEYSLSRDSVFRHVKRLVVYSSDNDRVRHLVGVSPYDDIEHVMQILRADLTSFRHVYRSDTCWKPLCRLVELLPALSDFVFACPYQFPPCLLETLHKHFRPSHLRLHICTFRLGSLANAELDPHEVALASSPLLHRIWVRYRNTNGYDWQNKPEYHADAVMDMATGFSPNLKEVRLFHDWRHGSYENAHQNHYLPPPPPAWKGFPKGAGTSNKGGALQYLELDVISEFEIYPLPGSHHLSEHHVRRWKAGTDFSVLRTLKLCQTPSREALVFLTEGCHFPSLTSLTLDYGSTTSGDDGVELVHRFLCSLPNLRSLELLSRMPIQQLEATAFSPSLTRLDLPCEPAYGVVIPYHRELLPSIIQRCPLIEHLSVAVPRYRGGAPEVRLYRAIGRLSRLRSLALTLDASSSDSEARCFEPQHVAEWNQAKGFAKSAIHHGLIDSAVDAKLAMAIFRAVSLGKKDAATTSGIAAMPLETLSVRVVGGERVVSDDMADRWAIYSRLLPFVTNMGRAWQVDRDPRDDRPDVLLAVEVGRDARLKKEPIHRQEDWPKDCRILPLFRQIWPEMEKGSHWREDWESWPLERLSDE